MLDPLNELDAGLLRATAQGIALTCVAVEPCLAASGGFCRQGGKRPRLVRHHHRADRRHRAVLAGAHPAREDRREAPPSAEGRDQDVVPAVVVLRRPAVAAGVAVGLHQAGRLQGRVRHRQARRLLQARWREQRAGAGELEHEELRDLREELDEHGRARQAARRSCEARARAAVARSSSAAVVATPRRRAGAADGNPAARHLLVLRLADLHQVQVAAVEHASQVIVVIIPIVGADGADPAAERRRAVVARRAGHQVRGAGRAAGARAA